MALRRIALVSLALVACVGDDPEATPGAPDASTASDAGDSSPGDAGGDTSSPPANDGGSDAGSCLAPAANMISWWTGDDTFADRLTANNMTPAGSSGTVTFGAGHVGNAIAFDGSRFLERALPIGLASLGGFTVEAWVKGDGNTNHRIFDRSTAGTGDGWLFDFWMTRLRFVVGAASVDSKTVMTIGATTHVAGTFDGSTLRVFVNGVEDNQASSNGVTTLPSPDHPLRIGGASDFSARWSGFIDEAAIYSRALTPAEIKAIFDAGANGRCK